MSDTSTPPSGRDYALLLDQSLEYVRSLKSTLVNLIERVRIANVPALADELDVLMAQLNLLDSRSAKSYIGFVGKRGAGKTTIVNRILETELLPTANTTATASLSEVHGWEDKKYQLDVWYICEEDWKQMVSTAMEIARMTTIDDRNADLMNLEEADEIRMVTNQLRVLWETVPPHERCTDLANWYHKDEFAMDPMSLLPSSITNLIRNVKIQSFSTENRRELVNTLASYTDYTARGSFWPVVFRLVIHGPFPLLVQNSVSILDIPGDGDANPVLLRRYEDGIQMCNRLFFLPEYNQLDSANVAKQWTKLSSFCGAHKFGIIVTHGRELVDDEKLMLRWNTEGLSKQSNILAGRVIMINALSSGLQVAGLLSHFREYLTNNVSVFCFDNGPYSKTLFDAQFSDFKEFLSEEVVAAGRDEMHLCLQYHLSRVNLILAVYREKLLQSNISQSINVKDTENHCKNFLFLLPQFQNVADAVNGFRASLTDTAILLDNLNWEETETAVDTVRYAKTMAALLNHWGRWPPVDIPQLVALGVLVPGSTLMTENRMRAVSLDLQRKIEVHMRSFFGNYFADPRFRSILDHAMEAFSQSAFPLAFSHGRQLLQSCIQELAQESCWRELQDLSLVRGSGIVGKMKQQLFCWIAQKYPSLRDMLLQTIQKQAGKAMETHLDSMVLAAGNVLGYCISALSQSVVVDAEIRHTLQQLLTEVNEHTQPLDTTILQAETIAETTGIAAVGIVVSDEEATERTLREFCRQHLLLSDEHLAIRMTGRVNDPGAVYVFSNRAMPNLYKIGFTVNLVSHRAKELFTTGVPHPFRIEGEWRSRNCKAMERILHSLFAKFRVSKNREFFQCGDLSTVTRAADLVSSYVDSIVERSRRPR